METWAFFTGDGTELCRGWRGTEGQARACAQRWADRTGGCVEFVSEGEISADGELVEPADEDEDVPDWALITRDDLDDGEG